jgi:hypothetical protein
MKLKLLLAALCVAPTMAFAQVPTCGTGIVRGNFAYTWHYLNQFPSDIKVAQQSLRDGFGYSGMAVDGKMGPQTLRALCNAVADHAAIFGREGTGVGDGQEIVRWMKQWADDKRAATANGTDFEAAD